MTELFFLFWPSVLATAFFALTLAITGAFLVTRQAGVQALPVAQAASFGVTAGLLFVQLFSRDSHLEHTLLPLVCGLLSAALGFALTERLARSSPAKTVIYLAAYALFWGLSQLLSGFFPSVEAHSGALFFGDVVTLTRGEAFFFMAVSILAALFLSLNWRRLAARAFLASILEKPLRLTNRSDFGFYVTSLSLLCLSVQFLGLLFTLSALFLPTALYSFSARTGAGRHLLRAGAAAFMAGGLGFLLSLADSRLLTTPVITALLGVFPLLHLGLERVFRCK